MSAKDFIPSFWPRLLPRVPAAKYCGTGTSKFDEMVRDGRMPKPMKIDSLSLWDRHRIDAAIDEMSGDDGPNPWDEVGEDTE